MEITKEQAEILLRTLRNITEVHSMDETERKELADLIDELSTHIGECSCGGSIFYAKQKCCHTVTVNEKGDFLSDVCLDDAGDPYGPFTCKTCGKMYEELPLWGKKS